LKARRILFLLILAVLTATAHADFKADMVMTEGSNTRTAKLCIKGDKLRMEMGDGSMVMIRRPDKGVLWMLWPKTKTYREVPDKETGRKTALYESMPGVKRLGTEKVNGYECNKYQISRGGKVPSTSTLWVSDKLNMEMKVISQAQGRTMTMEVKNVKRSLFLGKTFEVPKDYKKVTSSG
jgi:hypothetical protein